MNPNDTASTDAPAWSPVSEARLIDAAARGEVLEIVVVLRARVYRRSRQGSWRVRLLDGHYRLISSDSVIAATPITKRATPRAR